MQSLPVLFVPSMLLDGRMYTGQIAALSNSFPVQVAEIGRSDSIDQLAQDVLAAAPGRFALVGMSMGGIIALEVVARAPERGELASVMLCPVQVHMEMATSIPHADLVVLANAGQLSPMEEPVAVSSAIRTLLGRIH